MKSCRWRMVAVGLMVFAVACLGFSHPLCAQSSESDQKKLETVRKVSQQFAGKFPDAVEISPVEAMARSDQKEVIFVDVRSAEEMAVSMLPGAVTREAFEKNPGIADGKTAVAYCTIGARSGAFSQEMNRKGIRVLSLSGGMLAWLLEGGKIYHDGVETNRVHVFGDGWNYLPEGYKASTRGH